MFGKLFNVSGPSVSATGVAVSIQNVTINARYFAVLVSFCTLLRWAVDPPWKQVIDGLVLAACLIRFVVPERKTKEQSP